MAETTSAEAAFAQVDLLTAELELNGSIYEGFSTAIMVKGQPRTVALCREFNDAVQLMTIIAHAQTASPAEPSSVGEVEPYHARQIAEEIAEGSGFWKACSGCQESVDGYVSERDYPYNRVFQCQPGGGCSECGGLGVLWDNIDYDAMARDILADEDEPLNSQDDNADRCDVCLVAFKPDDICASDIDLGVAHAACLAGSPVVDLESGEPLPEGTPILTYRYDSLSEPGDAKA